MISMDKNKLLVVLTVAVVSASACTDHDAQPGLIVPEIRYELSGGAGHYDYAPSFIMDEYGIIYGFLCENRDPFKIVDYVYLYKGIPTKEGYVWQPATQIVAPSQDGWDNCHICDPDVREFETTWKGKTYHWIMTYLGVDQWDCCHNQIGLAVSECIEGPYIKYDGNPIVPYEGRDKWGVGQSTTVVKNDSTIVVYYHTSTDNRPYARREIILNDLDNIRVGEEQAVPHLPANSYPMYSEDKIYMVSEVWSEQFDKSQIPTWVGDYCKVYSMPIDGDMLAKDVNPWTLIGEVSPSLSGFPRNHNPGFLTDTRGYMPKDGRMVVYFTPAVTGADWLWSYDLYSATFKNVE